jgi:hypothetical protein
MIESPVLIVGCARSGTTLLYNVLSEIPDLWSIGYESKAIIEYFHHPSAKGWKSGALSAEDLTAESRAYMLSAFARQAAPGDYWRRINSLRALVNRSAIYAAVKRRGRGDSPGSAASSALPGRGLDAVRLLARLRYRPIPQRRPMRLLEKTPENCLRLPFLATLFPDARVIFLTRDGRANVHSLLEGWRQPHLFPGYQTPTPVTSPGQTRGRWAFTLISGWRELVDRPLEEISARQWVACNEAVLEYAATPNALPLLAVRYEDLTTDSGPVLAHIARFLDLKPESIPAYGRTLPMVNVVSRPEPEKWRAAAIGRVQAILEPMMSRLGYETSRGEARGDLPNRPTG